MSSEGRDERLSQRLPLTTSGELERLLDELKEYFHGCATDGDAPPPAWDCQPEQSAHRCRSSAEQP